MGHKPGQVSHQEWCHSWEPAAVDLEDMSIVRFTPTELYISMDTYTHVCTVFTTWSVVVWCAIACDKLFNVHKGIVISLCLLYEHNDLHDIVQ